MSKDVGSQEERSVRLENAVIRLSESQEQMSTMQRILYDILGNQDRILQRQEEAIAELRASNAELRASNAEFTTSQARQDQMIAELRTSNARQDQVIAELTTSNDEFRRRHEETDGLCPVGDHQRFNVLLEEVRFLIRQQQAEG